MNKFAAVAAVVLGLGAVGPAHAFIYEECSVSDVTFGVGGNAASNSDACFGWTSDYGNPTFEQTLVEDAFGTEIGNDWVYVTKFESSSATGSYGDVSFTLSANNSNDTWTLSWSDPVGNTLPSGFDIALVLKAGQGSGGYLFDDYVLPVTPNTGTGDFEVGILNNRGRELNLSHMTLFIRESGDTPPGPDNEVPVPGTLALLGAAAFGLRRKRKIAEEAEVVEAASVDIE
ncbi:MAG: PEP-CTERM sorting domain-containing protein [Chromatiales bacterium]|nr:PEP-CTERM sorting domain-containing protein [Gammaproteobacteria bacterium]MCP5353209.1 PEP-CTERM sorting domain-containing protein [Chromatiales bacterium]